MNEVLEQLNATTFTEVVVHNGQKMLREFKLEFTELLSSQAKSDKSYLFAVGKLADGRVAAAWEKHAKAFDSLAELLAQDDPPILNSHELTLLRYGIHQ